MAPYKTKEIVIALPAKTDTRWTVQLDMPDALLKRREEGTLGWNAYDSFFIESACLEER